MAYTTRELSSRTFSDFEKIAAKQGGCWCIFYQRAKPIRLKSSDPEWRKTNQRDKKALVEKGKSHAILVYDNGTPVGWCQYGVKEELPRIDAGRGYRKVGPPSGAEKLWRITWFFVDKAYRGKGVSKLALNAALDSIKRQGGGIVEAYPVVSKKMAAVAEWRWFGTPNMFKKEGFKTIAPLGTSGVLMRKTISPN
jgi:GNAT superfamily N-acetyltransferase